VDDVDRERFSASLATFNSRPRIQIMTRTIGLLVVLLFAVGAPLALAQEETTKEEKPATQSADEIVAEFEAADRAWNKRMRAASRSERQALFAERPDAAAFSARILAAISGREEAPSSAKGLVFIASASGDKKMSQAALGHIVKHHLGNAAAMKPLVGALSRDMSPAAGKALEAMAKSDDAEVAISAKYTMASRMKNMLQMASGYADADEDLKKRYVEFYGQETIDAASAMDAASTSKKVEAILDAVVKDERAASVDAGRGVSYADMAKKELFEIRNLSVGCKAPEITGPDVDGVTFNLSDYRGKVVFLDFWGHW
jgi:septal ring-binding cell division protein DamX